MIIGLSRTPGKVCRCQKFNYLTFKYRVHKRFWDAESRSGAFFWLKKRAAWRILGIENFLFFWRAAERKWEAQLEIGAIWEVQVEIPVGSTGNTCFQFTIDINLSNNFQFYDILSCQNANIFVENCWNTFANFFSDFRKKSRRSAIPRPKNCLCTWTFNWGVVVVVVVMTDRISLRSSLCEELDILSVENA